MLMRMKALTYKAEDGGWQACGDLVAFGPQQFMIDVMAVRATTTERGDEGADSM